MGSQVRPWDNLSSGAAASSNRAGETKGELKMCSGVCFSFLLFFFFSFSSSHEYVVNRAGPQSQKWSDQQITLNPTGSIHKKARKKKFDPKKVDFD